MLVTIATENLLRLKNKKKAKLANCPANTHWQHYTASPSTVNSRLIQMQRREAR